MNEVTRKRTKKRKKIDREARRRHLLMIKTGVVAAVVILIISIIAILKPFGSRDGISIDKEDIEVAEQEDGETIQEESGYKLSEAERNAALERIAAVDGLEQAWEDSWLKKIDISGDTCDYLTIDNCEIMSEDHSMVRVEGVLDGIPDSDSEDLYLFALNTYENSIPEGAEPAETHEAHLP